MLKCLKSKMKKRYYKLNKHYCETLTLNEYNIQKLRHTRNSIDKLKEFCAIEIKNDPNNFAQNVLSKFNPEKR